MKVLLSVYSVKILNQKNEQLLSKFGGNVDFLPLFRQFTKYIYKDVQHWERKGHPKLSLTLPKTNKIKFSNENRIIYGYLEAGRNGDEFRVKNFEKSPNKVKIINENDSSLRKAFFYLLVPKSSKIGYLILQVPEGKGIKHLLEYSLRKYINSQGLQQYHIEISNLINEKVFYKMLDNGLLKELTFTKYGIPDSIDGMNNSDTKPKIGTGSIKTIYHDNNLGERFKTYVKKIFKIKRKEDDSDVRSVIEFDNIQADELSVKVEFDGKQKTFHMENYTRTLPDIDVTKNVIDGKGKLDFDKLVAQAEELILEVKLTVKSHDFK